MSKILTVFGATGNQGGSVIRAVLADPVLSKEFKVRGITRDVSKPAAKALADQGVELVKVSRDLAVETLLPCLTSHRPTCRVCRLQPPPSRAPTRCFS